MLHFMPWAKKCQDFGLKYLRGECVTEIKDDPIVRCMERCGYPPWMLRGGADYEKQDDSCGEDENGNL